MTIETADPRTTPPAKIHNADYVPLAAAHLLIGKARVTVYRWANEDRIGIVELGEYGKGSQRYVRAGDVRELASRQSRRNAATKTGAK